MSKPFDSSVIGFTAEEFAAMDDEERAQEMFDALNRAADICQAAVAAFPNMRGGEAVEEVAQTLIAIARNQD